MQGFELAAAPRIQRLMYDIETCPDPWGGEVKQLMVIDTITGKLHLTTNSAEKAAECEADTPRSMIINAWSTRLTEELFNGLKT